MTATTTDTDPGTMTKSVEKPNILNHTIKTRKINKVILRSSTLTFGQCDSGQHHFLIVVALIV